jgi:hypothetical protein
VDQFVRSYQSDRHGFEARYQALGDAGRAALAHRQGATYVVAAAPAARGEQTGFRPGRGSLELLHVEGHYAVYRLASETLVQRQR